MFSNLKARKVVLTMDCEPTTATSHPAATGPANWSASEAAVLGYVEAAARYGLPVTFFVHPEAAVAQAAMAFVYGDCDRCLKAVVGSRRRRPLAHEVLQQSSGYSDHSSIGRSVCGS